MIRFASLVASALLLLACNMLVAGGSSSTETGDKVSLTGNVRGGNGDGVSGVIVTLIGTDLADTTDIQGAYTVSGTKPRNSAHDTMNGQDSLLFVLNGQTVATRAVSTLTTTVPDVQIVQRGFSGTFSGSGDGVTRIEAVLIGDGIASGDSVTARFFHNTLAGNYSGFIWFPPPTTTVDNYSIRIDVYGADDMLTGRSQAVSFNSLAGNITIPAFSPDNLVPPSGESVP